MIEKTVLLIKPNAVDNGNIGHIITKIENNGFDIVEMKMLSMDKSFAEEFYSSHRKKPFFKKLITFMTTGKSIALLLEKENAVEELRTLSGNTDPEKAEPNSIRKLYGLDITRNAVHSSDSLVNANREIKILFPFSQMSN